MEPNNASLLDGGYPAFLSNSEVPAFTEANCPTGSSVNCALYYDSDWATEVRLNVPCDTAIAGNACYATHACACQNNYYNIAETMPTFVALQSTTYPNVISLAFADSGNTGGDSGTGDSGTGDSGSGNGTGTGDAGTGDSGTGDSGTGDSGTGDSGTGDSGTGDSGTGDSGTGDSGTGDSGTGTGDGTGTDTGNTGGDNTGTTDGGSGDGTGTDTGNTGGDGTDTGATDGGSGDSTGTDSGNTGTGTDTGSGD